MIADGPVDASIVDDPLCNVVLVIHEIGLEPKHRRDLVVALGANALIVLFEKLPDLPILGSQVPRRLRMGVLGPARPAVPGDAGGTWIVLELKCERSHWSGSADLTAGAGSPAMVDPLVVRNVNIVV